MMKIKEPWEFPLYPPLFIVQFWPSGQEAGQQPSHGLWPVFSFFSLGVNSTQFSMMMPITNMSMAPQEKTMLTFWILLSGRWIIVDKSLYRRLPPMFHMSFLWWVRRWRTESECSLTAEVLPEISAEAEAEVTWRAEKITSCLYHSYIKGRLLSEQQIAMESSVCWFDPWPWVIKHWNNKAMQQFFERAIMWQGLIW